MRGRNATWVVENILKNEEKEGDDKTHPGKCDKQGWNDCLHLAARFQQQTHTKKEKNHSIMTLDTGCCDCKRSLHCEP